jgi:Na+/phosphate symporter
MYGYLKDGHKETKTAHSQALKEATTETHKLALAITELTVEIRNLKETTKHIPKIQKDLHILHGRVRELDPKYRRNGRDDHEE